MGEDVGTRRLLVARLKAWTGSIMFAKVLRTFVCFEEGRILVDERGWRKSGNRGENGVEGEEREEGEVVVKEKHEESKAFS